MMPVKMQSLIFPPQLIFMEWINMDSWMIPLITTGLTITAIINTEWGWEGTDIENIHHTMGRQ
jgi:hypothetical protein